WDLSAQNYSVIGTTTDSILDPAATPYAADFPTADVAVRLVDQFGYYGTSDTEVLDLGTRLSASSPSSINTDPASIVHFPADVDDTWTDAVATAASNSQLQVTILAEGAIILADAVIDDAVLVERRYITPSFTSVSTTWFRRSNCLAPLGNVLSNGGVIVRVPEDLMSAVTEVAAFDVRIGPNPAAHSIHVERTDGAALGELRLIDSAGREVRAVTTSSSRVEIDLTGSPEAAYVLRIASADGVRMMRVVRAVNGH
ncbi:MAG TPA: T9SS type A sorting domain-containing protein, partial [Flavobacteriales bacterium]|nr:T9SS type A sorting domain-containing protein [Flavobacteriales bacterium]